MKPKVQIVKIGGNILDNQPKLNNFISDFSALVGLKILVHGGGKTASQLSNKMGIIPEMVDGRRITCDNSIDIVTMVYAGLLNKKIVAKLQAHQCNAIGLSGADNNMIVSNKRNHRKINYGWVGDIKNINSTALRNLLNTNCTPVFCAITHDGKGNLLNTNADTIAAEIAIRLSEIYKTELIYCFEKKGVLSNINDDNSVIEQINLVSYKNLIKNNVITTGMLPKLESCFNALQNNVNKVIIGNTTAINNVNNSFTTVTLS